MTTAHPWRRFVAVGDSFSEGLSDVDPATPERYRGWADLLAAELAERAGGEEFHYANLAIRGRKLDDIAGQQLDRALALAPDLVSFVGGGNDIFRPSVDLEALAATIDAGVARIRATGADVLLATPSNPSHAGVFSALAGRHAIHSANLFGIAARHGAHVLDLWGAKSARDWQLWSEDRIHLNTEGHRRIAQAGLVALGLYPSDPEWDRPLAPAPARSLGERARENARWTASFAAPWVGRRLRGRSSGDGLDAKTPALQRISPAHDTSRGSASRA